MKINQELAQLWTRV